jgi:hypothetical protein
LLKTNIHFPGTVTIFILYLYIWIKMEIDMDLLSHMLHLHFGEKKIVSSNLLCIIFRIRNTKGTLLNNVMYMYQESVVTSNVEVMKINEFIMILCLFFLFYSFNLCI